MIGIAESLAKASVRRVARRLAPALVIASRRLAGRAGLCSMCMERTPDRWHRTDDGDLVAMCSRCARQWAWYERAEDHVSEIRAANELLRMYGAPPCRNVADGVRHLGGLWHDARRALDYVEAVLNEAGAPRDLSTDQRIRWAVIVGTKIASGWVQVADSRKLEADSWHAAYRSKNESDIAEGYAETARSHREDGDRLKQLTRELERKARDGEDLR